jgi:hypothetical protein
MGLALVICTGALHATVLTNAAPVIGTALTCNTTTGAAGSVTVKITAAAATTVLPVTVGVTVPAALQASVAVAGGATVNSGGYPVLTASGTTQSATYTFTPTAGCTGLNSGANAPVAQFLSSVGSSSTAIAVPVGTDVTSTLSEAVTVPATASPLTVAPVSIIVNCIYNSSSMTYASSAQTFTVSSAAIGGSPVTFDPNFMPKWLAVTPNSYPSDAVSASPVTFTATTVPQYCVGLQGTSQSATLHVLNAPATAYKTLAVTMQVVAPAALTLSSTPSLSSGVAVLPYTKNGTPATLALTVTGLNQYFSVAIASLPSWLTASSVAGTASSSGYPVNFTTTKVADSMTAGIYPTVYIHLQVAGCADSVFGVTLNLANAVPTLSVAEGITRNLSWTVGTPLPTPTITALSNGAPIAFVVTAGSTPSVNGLTPELSETSALAFNFGTPVPITFLNTPFATVQPGTTLTGSVILTCAPTASCANTSGTLTVAFAVSVVLPSTNAALTGISPSNLPAAVAGQSFTVTLYGAGFVFGLTNGQNTIAGPVVSGSIINDPNISVNVVNASTIILTLTVPTVADTNLHFAAPGGNVMIGVCNPNGAATCAAATGTMVLALGAGPVIQTGGITSASTFQTVTPGTGTVAPYDILSIFGSNFCSAGGTGCTGGQVLYPTVTNQTYPNVLSPDGIRGVQVFFYPTGLSAGGLGAAPLLFATNNQINVMVPGALAAGTQYDIVVKFNSVASLPYTVTGAVSNPGIFVIDPVLRQGAIELAASGMIVSNSAASAARLRTTETDSDVVAIYMTGLGTPTSAAANTPETNPSAFPTDCLSPANYEAAAGSLTSLDGVIMQPSVLPSGRFIPCFNQANITAKIGNVNVGSAGAATYAGWVSGSIAGLYQVNVQLPAIGVLTYMDGTTTGTPAAGVPVLVPVEVFVTTASGAQNSQPYTASYNVGMYVQPAATIGVTTAGVYTVAASAVVSGSANPIDTLTSIGGMITPNFTITNVSGSNAVGRAAETGDFSVGLTTGILSATNTTTLGYGTFYITVKLADVATTSPSPSGLPAEYRVLTLNVTNN